MDDGKMNRKDISTMIESKPEKMESLKRMSTEILQNSKPLSLSVEGKSTAKLQLIEKSQSMMEDSVTLKIESEEFEVETRKRVIEQELQPVLIRLPSEEPSCSSDCIRINKDKFKIGRRSDNDEVIISVFISRSHCVLHRDKKNGNWYVTNLSSVETMVNNKPIPKNSNQIIQEGDILQLTLADIFRYKFRFVNKDRESVKIPKLEVKQCELGNVLNKQKSFVAFQESERKDLEKQLSDKQLEQEKLKEELEKLLNDQKLTKDCNVELNNQIAQLQKKIDVGNFTELMLKQKYRDLLEILEEERLKFEGTLAAEKQKWQTILKETKQEKEKLEMSMVEQIEELREMMEKKQQEEWQKRIDNLLLEEKNVQSKLLDEKKLLENKLKQMEIELKQKEEQAKNQRELQLQKDKEQLLQLQLQQEQKKAKPTGLQNCIVLKVPDSIQIGNNNKRPLLETIDLTSDLENASSTSKSNQGDSVINKVNNIMDEQLTCSICAELFVRAMTLNCTHTFCRHCIDLWILKRRECPNCRAKIVSMTRSLVLDNFIEKMLESLTPEQMQTRKKLMEERIIYASKQKRCRRRSAR